MGLTSEQVHWIIGGLVTAFALVLILHQTGVLKARLLRYLLGGGVAALGVQVLLDPLIHGSAAPEGYGAETLQHMVQGLVVLGVGVVEILRARERLRHRAWKFVLPVGLSLVALVFLFHAQHKVEGPMVLLVVQHQILGATLLVAAVAKALGELEREATRSFAVTWLVVLLLAGVELLLYSEGGGGHTRATGPSRRRSMAATDSNTWARSSGATAVLAVLLAATSCTPALEAARPGELELRVGTLDALHPSSGEGSKYPHYYRWFRFPEPGWVTSFRPSVVDGAGRSAPRELLWQAVVADADRPDLLADGSSGTVRVLFAAGPELTTIQLPEGFGIPVDEETECFAEAVFTGPTPRGDTLSFRAALGFVPASSGRSLRAVVPVWLDVLGPAGTGERPDRGRELTTRELRFPWPGRLLLAAGQLLEHGVRLRVLRLDSGQELLRIEPVHRGRSSGIDEIPLARFDDPPWIDPGSAYVLESVYEEAASPEESSRGVVLAFVAPDRVADVRDMPQGGGR